MILKIAVLPHFSQGSDANVLLIEVVLNCGRVRDDKELPYAILTIHLTAMLYGGTDKPGHTTWYRWVVIAIRSEPLNADNWIQWLNAMGHVKKYGV